MTAGQALVGGALRCSGARPMLPIRITGLDGEPIEIEARLLETLSASLDGPVLLRGDERFDQAIQIWNGMSSRPPALVVQPSSAGDVREVVNFAHAHGLLLSIKGGGHHIAGTALADGGLTLDMSRMRSVEIDPERRLARVGPGCLVRDLDRAAQEYGLATVLASDPRTGVAGLTLGGGFGYLTRRLGASLDNLEEIDVVTADGAVLRAAADENEDIFWASRGGGGNFGVVTRFTFRLHPVGPRVVGGILLWDAAEADDVFGAYRQLAEAGSRDLSLSLIMRPAPAAPFVPEAWHGKPVVGVLACHFGQAGKADNDLAPLHALGKPIVNVITTRTYVEQQAILDGALGPRGMHSYWKSEFLPSLTTGMLDALRKGAAGITSPLSLVMLYQLGGALGDHEPADAAFGDRDAAYSYIAAGCWPPTATDTSRHIAWVHSAWAAMRPYSTGGNYINVQTADEDVGRIRAAYRENFARLAKVKGLRDPHNLFRVNRNIEPAFA